MNDDSDARAERTSRIAGMRAMSPQDRGVAVKRAAGLGAEVDLTPALPLTCADGMIENVIGTR